MLTDAELLDRIGSSAMVATLEQIDPIPSNLPWYISESIPTIQKNVAEIKEVCRKPKTVGELRSMLNTLFRPLFLDGITMLELIGERDLAEEFSQVQRHFLNALRQNADAVVVLKDNIPLNVFEDAVDAYVKLISKESN